MFSLSPWLILAIPWLILWFIASGYFKALAIYKCWDTSPEVKERLTFNPKQHIDFFGFIAILIFWFWWGKHLEIHEEKLNDKMYDPIKIAIFSLFWYALTALVSTLVYVIIYRHTSIESPLFMTAFIYVIYLNWALFFFNILPIPPLTGSIVLLHWLKFKNPELHTKIYAYSSLIILVLILVSNFWGMSIFPTWTIAQYWWDFFLKFFLRYI